MGLIRCFCWSMLCNLGCTTHISLSLSLLSFFWLGGGGISALVSFGLCIDGCEGPFLESVQAQAKARTLGLIVVV